MMVSSGQFSFFLFFLDSQKKVITFVNDESFVGSTKKNKKFSQGPHFVFFAPGPTNARYAKCWCLMTLVKEARVLLIAVANSLGHVCQ